MKYTDFENAFFSERISRYIAACNGDKRRAMTLYRYNSLMGQTLLHIFPKKPTSTRQHRYDNSYVFQELDYINKLRNRIAHHEPICFSRPNPIIDTSYAFNQYTRIIRLLNWMDINSSSLLFGLDHVSDACSKINNL